MNECENAQLKKQLIDANQPTDNCPHQTPKTKLWLQYLEKIVLYGVEEYHCETEEELRTRIINSFQNILNVNLVGYIEVLKRTGR